MDTGRDRELKIFKQRYMNVWESSGQLKGNDVISLIILRYYAGYLSPAVS